MCKPAKSIENCKQNQRYSLLIIDNEFGVAKTFGHI